MKQETLETLHEFKDLIIRELDQYCEISAKAAGLQLKYERKHPNEPHSLPASMANLSMYYGYSGARDVVNEMFDEFLSRPEGSDKQDNKE